MRPGVNLLWPRWAELVAHLHVKTIAARGSRCVYLMRKAGGFLANRYGREQDARFARLAWERSRPELREPWARPRRLRLVKLLPFVLSFAFAAPGDAQDERDRRSPAAATLPAVLELPPAPAWLESAAVSAAPHLRAGEPQEVGSHAGERASFVGDGLESGITHNGYFPEAIGERLEEFEHDPSSLPEPGRLYKALGWAMFPASAGDFASTEYALAGGGSELNPLMQNRGARIAGSVAFPFAMNYLSEELRKDGHPKLALWMRIAVVGLKGYAVFHNLRAAP
jgi:hypothetical protein